jgi:hypothetical protein
MSPKYLPRRFLINDRTLECAQSLSYVSSRTLRTISSPWNNSLVKSDVCAVVVLADNHGPVAAVGASENSSEGCALETDSIWTRPFFSLSACLSSLNLYIFLCKFITDLCLGDHGFRGSGNGPVEQSRNEFADHVRSGCSRALQ